jgi:hypothetical protein
MVGSKTLWKRNSLDMFEKKLPNKIFSPENEIVIGLFRIQIEEFRGVYGSAIVNYKNDENYEVSISRAFSRNG